MHGLVFDLGMHVGEDTAFYLAKGFRVVAAEANPHLYAAGQERFADEIRTGKLTIVHAAVADANGERTFFVHPKLSEKGSLRRDLGSVGGVTPEEVTVRTITLPDLIGVHGLPYYIKADIEGQDGVVSGQLQTLAEKPPFVSFEASDPIIFFHLRDAGYKRLQLVQQQMNWTRKSSPSSEGLDVTDWKFEPGCSGLFGRDLPREKWLGLDEAFDRYRMYRKLQAVDAELGWGWVDIHAALWPV